MPSGSPGDPLTKFLAVWGAILGSVTLGWNLYRDLLDRPRMKVEARLRRIGQATDGRWFVVNPELPVEGASRKLYVVMEATNVGRRQIQWDGWGGRYRSPVNGRNSFTIIAQNLPKTLSEGQSHSEMTDELLDKIATNVRQLFAWDSRGKYWHVSRRQFRKLIADARKFGAAGQGGA